MFRWFERDYIKQLIYIKKVLDFVYFCEDSYMRESYMRESYMRESYMRENLIKI